MKLKLNENYEFLKKLSEKKESEITQEDRDQVAEFADKFEKLVNDLEKKWMMIQILEAKRKYY